MTTRNVKTKPIKILVYPNPSSNNNITIRIKDLNEYKNFNVVITDVLGRIVLNESIHSSTFMISSECLPNPNFYIYHIFSEGNLLKTGKIAFK